MFRRDYAGRKGFALCCSCPIDGCVFRSIRPERQYLKLTDLHQQRQKTQFFQVGKAF